VDATPLTPTTATVAITPPPAADGPWPSFKVTACPIGGGACITTSCTTPASCPLTGLTPDTTYAVTALGVRPDGSTSPPSNEDIITTPSSLGVRLTSAEPTGATTGLATATPLPGVTFPQYTFTATPVNGSGPAVAVVSTSPEARFRDLLPNTQVRRLCWVLEVLGCCIAFGAGVPGCWGARVLSSSLLSKPSPVFASTVLLPLQRRLPGESALPQACASHCSACRECCAVQRDCGGHPG